MNNGVVPHNHIYSIGIYSREQPAKLSSVGTCDSTQLLCYTMTESVLRLLKGNCYMWLINLSVLSTNWAKLELERIINEAVGVVFLHIFLRRDVCYELRLGYQMFQLAGDRLRSVAWQGAGCRVQNPGWRVSFQLSVLKMCLYQSQFPIPQLSNQRTICDDC